jgi:hypothetical protein
VDWGVLRQNMLNGSKGANLMTFRLDLGLYSWVLAPGYLSSPQAEGPVRPIVSPELNPDYKQRRADGCSKIENPGAQRVAKSETAIWSSCPRAYCTCDYGGIVGVRLQAIPLSLA